MTRHKVRGEALAKIREMDDVEDRRGLIDSEKQNRRQWRLVVAAKDKKGRDRLEATVQAAVVERGRCKYTLFSPCSKREEEVHQVDGGGRVGGCRSLLQIRRIVWCDLS